MRQFLTNLFIKSSQLLIPFTILMVVPTMLLTLAKYILDFSWIWVIIPIVAIYIIAVSAAMYYTYVGDKSDKAE